MNEYLRPWKLITFAIGVGILIVGSYYYDTYDWDIGISLIMGVLAYLTAPWALLVVKSHKWRLFPFAVFVYWFTVDGSYVSYNAYQGHPVSAELRLANYFASTLLYLLCAYLWAPKMDLMELIAGKNKKKSRDVDGNITKR